MADDSYSVRINRREGVVEITGSDKEWIAEQIGRLSIVYADPPLDAISEDEPPSSEKSESITKRTQTARKKRATPRSAPSASDSEVAAKFTKDAAAGFQKYWDERDEETVKTQPDRAAVIATFIQDELGIEAIEASDLLVVHRAMGWAPPGNPRGVIDNAIQRRGYFTGLRDGKTSLTPKGEHFGRHASKEPTPKK